MIQPDFEEEQLNRLLAMIDSGSQPQDESDQLPAIAYVREESHFSVELEGSFAPDHRKGSKAKSDSLGMSKPVEASLSFAVISSELLICSLLQV
jgi:hypothetical protein